MQGMVFGSAAAEVAPLLASVKAELEPMDLADMVVKSILLCPKDMQPKLASNIVLAGGVALTQSLITQTEDLVFQQLQKHVDTVEILLINIQQQQQQQLINQMQPQSPEQLGLKTDPRYVQWVGASCVAKVSAAEELFVPCEKLKLKFVNYQEHCQQMSKAVQEELHPQPDLSIEQLAEIEKESLKRVKRDRYAMLECGLRLVSEKATFAI